jgi:hypothetical protein
VQTIEFPEQTQAGCPLVELQFQVARRADELSATRADRTPLNLACWLQAEEEILASFRGEAA